MTCIICSYNIQQLRGLLILIFSKSWLLHTSFTLKWKNTWDLKNQLSFFCLTIIYTRDLEKYHWKSLWALNEIWKELFLTIVYYVYGSCAVLHQNMISIICLKASTLNIITNWIISNVLYVLVKGSLSRFCKVVFFCY